MEALSQGKVRTEMFKEIKACKDRLLTRRTLGEGVLRVGVAGAVLDRVCI
jgi:hypothetical protein